jgi:hypothetical protein
LVFNPSQPLKKLHTNRWKTQPNHIETPAKLQAQPNFNLQWLHANSTPAYLIAKFHTELQTPHNRPITNRWNTQPIHIETPTNFQPTITARQLNPSLPNSQISTYQTARQLNPSLPYRPSLFCLFY